MEDQINGVATSIRNKMGYIPSYRTHNHNHCIYKVPQYIRKENEESYRPSLIAIGPIYHGDPTLQAMEELKLQHLHWFLQEGNNADNMEHYINVVCEWEEEARSYYAHKISVSSNDFVEMLLIDAVFMIVLFMWSNSQLLLESHPMENKAQFLLILESDLFCEENQLPFFVLERLYDIAFGRTIFPNSTFSLVTAVFLSKSWYRESGPSETEIEQQLSLSRASKINHLLDFVRIAYLPTKLREQFPCNRSKVDPQFPLTATELKAAGIKFMEGKGRMLDISFDNGVLKIPKLIFRDSTESVLRNMAFYEQCHHFHDTYFVDYFRFLGKLVKTAGDVQILVQSGVLLNWLGSDEEVANVLHKSSKNIILNHQNFYYFDVSRELNAHANTSWNRWKTILRRDYFSHP
ncbi:UPF0481 protein At3g47200-like [Amaranthus tricolor]|uniref:UPF0481 protein At3g47200-like n=1 Tax=Amaranthus tricolor TaxID=29722 RepID=UPI002583E895|nr:UPF0481 protein At3g47200-like [Amaranthus tricolor]